MALTKRCPHCGASNPESAQWCSLCLERFVEPEPDPEPDLHHEPAGAETSATAGATTATRTAEYSAFQVTEEGIKWLCATCGTPNSIDSSACATCGTTFAETVRPKVERPQRDPAKAALFSLFFPGAGHAYVGMWGQAVARGILSAWLLLVTLVGLLDKKVPGSLFMATIFGLAAFGLWLITAHDAFREATNDTNLVVLKGKRFLYVVLGLMALLFVVMFAAMMSARSSVDDTDAVGGPSIQGWLSTSSPISTEPPTN